MFRVCAASESAVCVPVWCGRSRALAVVHDGTDDARESVVCVRVQVLLLDCGVKLKRPAAREETDEL